MWQFVGDPEPQFVMSEPPRLRLRVYLSGFVTLAELADLAWEHFHGGVVSHHLLHRRDLPAVSNWWGVLLLPALTWFLIGRVERRVAGSKLPASVVAGFIGSLLFGVALSVAFTYHYESVARYLSGAMLLLAVFLPIYRAEYLLGFVLGMNFTFGAVLPTAAGSIIGGLSAIVHLVLRPFVARLWNYF